MNVIKNIEKVFFATSRYWGGLNSSLYNSGSVWAMNTGIESADLNMVWNEKPLTASDGRTIQEIKENFRKIKLPFWWWVFPGAQSQCTDKMLKAEDFSLVAGLPAMLADLSTIDDDHYDTSLQIMQISSKEKLTQWEDVSFAGFDFTPQTRQQYQRFIGTFNLNVDSPQKFFLAYWHGNPVATSLLFLHENTGGIYFVSTLKQHRRKGFGLALTLATMRHAKQSGSQFVSLQSSPDGLRVYQQAGFKEYCRVDIYSLK